jgi:salicylate hydroxylase
VASSRTLIVAGAGIGGLTAALALAANGFSVKILERSERLEATGAGIQLSPNATRVLLALGLEAKLRPQILVPERLVVRAASSGRRIAEMPLGAAAQSRYGAPYWVIHRADLQAVLAEAAAANPAVAVELGTALEDFAIDRDGVTVRSRRGDASVVEARGIGLVGADGLWSSVRALVEGPSPPRFRQRVAWRASVPAADVGDDCSSPNVQLWLGRDAHLVHYPVKGGALINIVAIARDQSPERGWSNAGTREEVFARFPRSAWAEAARDLLAVPNQWLKWALFDRPPLRRQPTGPVTLLGDAAHPMLPFLAQGAAMAIEDAGALADALAASPHDPASAMRRYEALRRPRTARVADSARHTGTIYELARPAAMMRDAAMRALGGERLLARQDWIFGYRIWPKVEPEAGIVR